MPFSAGSIDQLKQAAAVMLSIFAFSCGDGGKGSTDGIKRVTLTGNYVTSTTGQGWSLDSEQIARNSGDADFSLTMKMVISLKPNQPQVGFCEQTPPMGAGGFKHIKEVPSDFASCNDWTLAYLGGNSPLISETFSGRGFIVRNRDAVPIAKLMTVSASIDRGDVRVTFDIVKL